ncbi:vacuolar protein sorting-associated protein 37A [Pieris rapae]|uniref:vacuolar protein sorting-associated protein 37A n=1 Tax=Pieris rapae TaxID=64459 RepID=UPI001E27FAB3|nr:vacuolar protein sorting-associated protein 37A [Pieris rapae]XP_022121160.2 vacuolar protein sorting-associated protein 37A [Pieris rapae]XP_045487226.1 vacuolar protein sorting-associated protein 37A [Pieris rapae]
MIPRQYYNERDLRKRQIDALKVFNDNVTEVKEHTKYKVEFMANSRNMVLNIVLSPEFPNDKPAIFVNPVFNHPWLGENSNQVVGAPGLLNYTVHSDLGRVVQAIIREFQRSVPSIANEDKSTDTSPQSHISVNSLMFPELSELNIEELQEILENPDLQDKLLENNPQLAEIDQETEELMNSIEEIAQDNLKKQEMLDDMKSKVLEGISTIVQMKMSYEDLNKRYQELCEGYSPHHIRDCLKDAAIRADEDAEAIAEQFLLGNVSVETFVMKFAEKRALGQARRAREERLAHQLAQLDRATT